MTTAIATHAHGASTEAELRAAIGPRADDYLDAWSGSGRRFNWAGFFASMLWVSYRKMYRFTAILSALIVVEAVAEEAVFVAWLGAAEVPRWMNTLSGLVVGCVCGRFGNDWYRTHVERLIASARSAEPDEEARLRLLARWGGRSVWAAVAAMVVFLVAMVTALLCVDAIVAVVAKASLPGA